ncbi:MAG TPA: PilZ domain-containing protein, partial [Tepidisphaeraceae bacterium]|nr:PilZ domain-containing protein [Tepidisphaeraceae bacterium]
MDAPSDRNVSLSLNRLRGVSPPHEGRTQERYLAERPVHVLAASGPFDGWLLDVSAGGAALIAPHALQPGEEIVVVLDSPLGTRRSSHRVRYCIKLWEDAHQVGAERGDQPENTVSFLDAVLADPPSEVGSVEPRPPFAFDS